MARKLFFSEHDDEMCSTIDYWKDYMKENFVDKMILHLAERETGTDYFYCKEYFAVGEKGECGKSCDGYKPNNGKNGRCKHFGYCYDMTETKFLLERVGEKFKVSFLHIHNVGRPASAGAVGANCKPTKGRQSP